MDNYQKKKAIYSRSTQMMFYQCKFFLYFQQNSRAWFLFGILALTHFNPRLFKYAPGNEQGILKELKFPNDSVKFSNDFHSNRKRRLFLLLYQTQLHSISKCNFFFNLHVLNFKERTKAETLNSKLKQQLADYKVPDVSIHCCNLCQVDTAAVHMM